MDSLILRSAADQPAGYDRVKTVKTLIASMKEHLVLEFN